LDSQAAGRPNPSSTKSAPDGGRPYQFGYVTAIVDKLQLQLAGWIPSTGSKIFLLPA
jgi:hypothetical protein